MSSAAVESRASPEPAPGQSAAPERRSRLRQYQMQLLERMQAAKTGALAGGRELGVLIGGSHCLLDLTQISEIVPRQPVAPVPLAQDWFKGLANIRGNLTGVIDIARYQGMPACGSGADSRLITFAPGLSFNCALLVERVLGLRKLADMEVQADEGELAWRRQHFQDHDGQRWTRIDLARLVCEPRFLQVGL